MKPNNLRTVSMVTILTLIACTSKPQAINHNFITNISDDGSKRFELSIELYHTPAEKHAGQQTQQRTGDTTKTTRPEGRKGKGSRKGGGGMASAGETENMQKLLNTQLAQVMLDTGYCQQGYMIFEQNLSREFLSIRGECNEGAQ
ncbi:hypothetical protein [Thalassotalea litorea]|uniref:hypothetical protein n=1 Tax=Thalassotalea litorea TaxID=2020715 RepID=UPI003735F374